MEQIFSFLINNEKVVWAMLSVIIFGIIYALKIPYKKLTSKITKESVRQLANKVIVLLTFALSIGITIAYTKIVGVEFSIADSIKYATTAESIPPDTPTTRPLQLASYTFSLSQSTVLSIFKLISICISPFYFTFFSYYYYNIEQLMLC